MFGLADDSRTTDLERDQINSLGANSGWTYPVVSLKLKSVIFNINFVGEIHRALEHS